MNRYRLYFFDLLFFSLNYVILMKVTFFYPDICSVFMSLLYRNPMMVNLSGAQGLTQACIKTLSKSELFDQREFNGVMALKRMLGEGGKDMEASFSIRGAPHKESVRVKWYDARVNHQLRSEFRFYYEPNTVMKNAIPGDNIVIGFDRSNKLHCILFKSGSAEHQGNIESWSAY